MGRLVTIDQIERARATLSGVVARTPVQPSRAVSSMVGAQVLLKCEHLQRTGSFKLRGAYNRIASLSPAEREHGGVRPSAGNHAHGAALSAPAPGVRRPVFSPAAAPLPPAAARRGAGADDNQLLRVAPHLVNPLRIVVSRHTAFHQAHVVRSLDFPSRRFRKVRNFDGAG